MTMEPRDPHAMQRLLGLLYTAHPWHGLTAGEEAPAVVTAYIELVPEGKPIRQLVG